MAEALLRAHCDLRWYSGYSGKGSVALAENAAVGFDHAWERSVQNRMLSGKPSETQRDIKPENADLARAAFEAYGASTGWKTWDGKPAEPFDVIRQNTPHVAAAWEVAAEAVRKLVKP
jgi:hypothetical protein